VKPSETPDELRALLADILCQAVDGEFVGLVDGGAVQGLK